MDDDLPSSRKFLRLYKRNVNVQIDLCSALQVISVLSVGAIFRLVRRAVAARIQSQEVARELEEDALQQRETEDAARLDSQSVYAEGLRHFSKAAARRVKMLKVAIVGCGKIADEHASQIQRIRGCEIVGVCDREPLMARQLRAVPDQADFPRLGEMLDEAKPDVVHITTPPESHFEIAKICLEPGCHVYVEKPFTSMRARREG